MNRIEVDGLGVGDRILALISEKDYIFAKIERIEIMEESVRYHAKHYPILKEEIISNITLEGPDKAIALIDKLRADTVTYLYAFCQARIEDWYKLSGYEQSVKSADFCRILDKLGKYQKLLIKLRNYSKNLEESEND